MISEFVALCIGKSDAVDSKSTARKGVPVQVRGPVLKKNAPAMVGAFFFGCCDVPNASTEVGCQIGQHKQASDHQ